MAYKDYYAILGVSKGASEADIKSAFKQLARKYHPDINKDAGAEDKFKEINEAYTVLSDPQKRQTYDMYGADVGNRMPPGGGFGGGADPDFFTQLFGQAMGGNFGNFSNFGDLFGGGRANRAADMEAELPFTVREAFAGGEKDITTGGERLKINVPKAVKDGQKIRLSGKGQHGGHLYLKVKIVSDAACRLEGNNVYMTADVPVTTAVLGGSVIVHTLEGKVELSVKAGTSGQKMRLSGKGWPSGSTRGDLYVELRVVVPKTLSEQQLELYRQLQALEQA